MKSILSFVLFAATSFISVAAPPSIEPFDGARYMFVGASATSHHRWPAYFAAYFSLRYPQYQLHFAMDAAGGTTISRMFSNEEFGFPTTSSLANHHVHKRTVKPWGADFVFIQHAISGGYTPENDALHRQSYIENYCDPDGIVPILINTWQIAEPSNTTAGQGKSEETAINDLAIANDWNSSTIYDRSWDNWGTEYTYTADAATNIITAVGHPFSDGMRVRIGRITGTQATPLTVPTDYYVRDISGDAFKLSMTAGGSTIDITAPTTGTVRISRKWALINGHDQSHAGAAGYMALWLYMMDSLGLDTSVSQASINAATASVTSQNQCTISSVAVNAYDGVNFNRLDTRLPYVLDDDWWADAVELEPALLTHQDYSMTVTGLSSGNYDIYANGVLIGSATGAELGTGWNMAALQVGPVFVKGKEVLGRIRDAQGVVRADHAANADLPGATPVSGFEKYRATAATSYNTTGNRDSAHVAALATQLGLCNALDAAIKTAAQPETIAFSIRKANQSLPPASSKAWNYAGVPYTDWAYDPFTHSAPTAPAAWPAAEYVGYYYVAPDDLNATDVVGANDTRDARGLRYGYPARPRKTLPLNNANTNLFAEGDVIWIKGGKFEKAYGTAKTMSISMPGTASKPCWIYGDPQNPPVFHDVRISFYASSHCFVEGVTWGANTSETSCLSINRNDKNGPSHHITVRHCLVRDRAYLAHGSLFNVVAPAAGTGGLDADVHDVVFYRNRFTNNGFGANFDLVDADVHGYKLNGMWGGNRAYRIWLIEDSVTPGAVVDPVDGFRKSLAGNYAQVGDQLVTQGNVDHVYIAGATTEGMRQGCVGLKRCGHVVVSSNSCRNLLQADTSQGQAFNVKYDRQENVWFVNNFAENVDAFIIRAEATSSGSGGADTFLPENTRVHIIGNVFKNCLRTPFNAPDVGGIGGWKTKGISIQEMRGKVYIANNTVDQSVYGVYFSPHPGRQAVGAEMHVYNNIATRLEAGEDTSTAAVNGIMVTTDTGTTQFYFENNLVDSGRFYFAGTQYSSAAGFNARTNAAGNVQGDPLFADANHTLKTGSPAINAGVRDYTTNESPDVYQLFIDAFGNDQDFPGDPADVWPRDRMGKPRVQGSAIDIGAIEFDKSSGGSVISKPRGLEVVPKR